jgi:hypothetical protein
VRAVYVLEKRPDVSGPGLEEAGRYRIDVNEGSKPVKQWLRHFSPDKKAAIKKEITKLMAAGFIMKILHPN